MTTHTQARAFAAQALKSLLGREPSHGEIIHLAGIGCLETNYGDGWQGAGRGSYNMGAIQCGASWQGDRFEYTDTHPNSDGTSTTYKIAFRKYVSPVDGWSDLSRVAYRNRGRDVVRAQADKLCTLGVSTGLYDTGYYEGFGRDRTERIAHHFRALSGAVARADRESEVPEPATDPVLPVLRRGDQGQAVKLLQRELRIVADGIFGPMTENKVKSYQQVHGLKADGVAGPATWRVLLSDDFEPEAG